MQQYDRAERHDSVDWLVGGGETGRLIRSMDWSKTPLGQRHDWPQSLRTVVTLCLDSNFPIAIIWGRQRTLLYNDAYCALCGTKHPGSMGQDYWDCWPAARPDVAEALDQAGAGTPSFKVNHRVFLNRHGYLEETFFTFSFSPVSDETGAVAGLFHPIIEVTQQTLAERRLQIIRGLADAMADARNLSQASALAAESLGTCPLDLPFVLIYRVDHERRQAHLSDTAGLAPDSAAAPDHIDLAAGEQRQWPLGRVVASGSLAVVDDLERRFGPISAGPYGESPRQAVMMPLRFTGKDWPDVVAIVGISPRRALDDGYRGFFEMLQNALNTALFNTRAYDQEHERVEELTRIDRAKTTFLSNFSREFRTPLALTLESLETVVDAPGCALPGTDRKRLETALRNALRLHKLVNLLYDFTLIEAGRAQPAFMATDLAAFTTELASMFRSAVESAGLKFIVDCRSLPEPVYVDPGMWEKVVLNLISNALKFTFRGRIVVRLRWEDGGAALSVSDTGVGVPPEHLPHLFERFYQVPNARSRTSEGSGIGLALVHQLVQLHRGNISVESVLDEGTTCRVAIPRGTAHLPAGRVLSQPVRRFATVEARAFVAEAAGWLPAGGGSGMSVEVGDERSTVSAEEPPEPRGRVLLADDNADMRWSLEVLLAPHWRVEAVSDGLQALEAVQRERPDLVLADVMMPRLDGFGLLAALRADPETRDLPVIMLSGRAGEEARVEGLDAGADDYLVKPFSTREVLARIRTHLHIAELRREAVEMAQRDPLTGLPNRGLCYEFTERLLADARRRSAQVALLFVDLDRFKAINDTYGHEAGDRVLKEVAYRLKTGVREADTLGRLGGDEFLVVLSQVREAADAAHVAGHMIASLGRPYQVDGLELHSSPSIGISVFPSDGEDIDTLIRNADAAMYYAKQCGRNNFQFYRQDLNERTERTLNIELSMREALQGGQFSLYYQPIVNTSGGEVVAAEALARWPATTYGPGEFIPVAESSGIIGEFCSWVFRQACAQMRQWREQGLAAPMLSVNVSPLQFRQPHLLELIAEALREFEIDPSTIQIEITESSLFDNIERAMVTLGAMKDMGFSIALDDFGKGYSSLSYLGRLPLDTIKVDQSFVHTLDSDPASAAVIDAVVGIGQKLGIRVVAEGIESVESLAAVRDKDCACAQGFYVCPPVAADDFAAWYRRRLSV